MNEKEKQRQSAKLARSAMGKVERERKSALAVERIIDHPSFRDARMILSYFAFSSELDVNALDRIAQNTGKQVAYPICDAIGGMVAVLPFQIDHIVDRYGIKEPKLNESKVIMPSQIDLVIVPGVAFGKDMMRVGWGKGYYDRYLPLCNKAFRMAVCFEEQFFDSVAHSAWDTPMNAIATDFALYR